MPPVPSREAAVETGRGCKEGHTRVHASQHSQGQGTLQLTASVLIQF